MCLLYLRTGTGRPEDELFSSGVGILQPLSQIQPPPVLVEVSLDTARPEFVHERSPAGLPSL